MFYKLTSTIIFTSIFLIACSDEAKEKSREVNDSIKERFVERKVEPIEYSRGQKLFLANCSACHGKQPLFPRHIPLHLGE